MSDYGADANVLMCVVQYDMEDSSITSGTGPMSEASGGISVIVICDSCPPHPHQAVSNHTGGCVCSGDLIPSSWSCHGNPPPPPPQVHLLLAYLQGDVRHKVRMASLQNLLYTARHAPHSWSKGSLQVSALYKL